MKQLINFILHCTNYKISRIKRESIKKSTNENPWVQNLEREINKWKSHTDMIYIILNYIT